METTTKRFAEIAKEIDDRLIGAQRCENHLRALIESWNVQTDREKYDSVTMALDRLTK